MIRSLPLPVLTRRCRGLFSRKQRRLINEAQAVAPRIFYVERSLTPRTHHDLACLLIVISILAQAIHCFRALEDLFEIVHGKVDVIRRRLWRLACESNELPVPGSISRSA